jgi:hypothetical protein
MMGVVYELQHFCYAQVPLSLGKNGNMSMNITRLAVVRDDSTESHFVKRRRMRVLTGTDKVLQFPVV